MKPQSIKLAIEVDGEITAIYSDDLAPLMSEGRTKIKRASNVEWHHNAMIDGERRGAWFATMRDGMKLGPFDYRADALADEVRYLETQLGL